MTEVRVRVFRLVDVLSAFPLWWVVPASPEEKGHRNFIFFGNIPQQYMLLTDNQLKVESEGDMSGHRQRRVARLVMTVG